MNEYLITDFELNSKKVRVKAQGVAEAMFEYLPWPKLDINVYFDFEKPYTIIDRYTDFKYEIEPFINAR